MSKCRFCLLPLMEREVMADKLGRLEPEKAGELIREAVETDLCPEARLELARRINRLLAGPLDSATRISVPTLH